MAALFIAAFTFLSITLLGGLSGDTDDEFLVSYITLFLTDYEFLPSGLCKGMI